MNPSKTEKPVASTPNTPGGAVAVGEVAPLGSTSAHDQHQRHGDRGHRDHDERRPDDVHRAEPRNVTSVDLEASATGSPDAATGSAPLAG